MAGPLPDRPLASSRGFEVRSGTLDARGNVQGSIPHLVEARAAVHGPIIPWSKRNDGLTPAGAADCGMEFTWSLSGSSALGCRPARRASLRVVQQALARIKGLFAGGEGELLPAVATGQTSILVHPRRFLLARSLVTVQVPLPVSWGNRWARHGRDARSIGSPASGRRDSLREDTRGVKGSEWTDFVFKRAF